MWLARAQTESRLQLPRRPSAQSASIKRRIGKVIGQAPKAGARRPVGTSVSLVVGADR